MGSRSGRSSNAAWLARGTRLRTRRPCSTRTEGWTHGRAVQVSPEGGSGAQACSYVAGLSALAAMVSTFLDGITLARGRLVPSHSVRLS